MEINHKLQSSPSKLTTFEQLIAFVGNVSTKQFSGKFEADAQGAGAISVPELEPRVTRELEPNRSQDSRIFGTLAHFAKMFLSQKKNPPTTKKLFAFTNNMV